MTWLAFSRVPPVPALAPAGSAQSLGKVNANTGWLAHMNHSIYVFVLLPFTLLLHVKFPVSCFPKYLSFTFTFNGCDFQ